MSKGRHRCWLALSFVLCLFLAPSAAVTSDEFDIEDAILVVYRDGLTHVTQRLTVNETLPSIALTLLTPSVENVLVVDENQTVLDADLDGANLTVYTLGVPRVTVAYDTLALTAKDAGVWTILLTTPYSLSVHLPADATIVYLSAMPTAIETVEGRVTLALPPTTWEISYVLPIAGPARFTVTDLTVDPAKVDVDHAVTVAARVSNTGGAEGAYTAILIVNQVQVDSKTVTLAAGASTRVEFHVTPDAAGTYTVAIGELPGAFTAEAPPLIPAPMTYLAIIAAAIIVIGYVGVVRRRTSSAERILEDHQELRPDDRAIIRFLEERGGTAFESEIRDRFPDMPRTSLWRLIRRLEKLEIVTITKIGLQNQVELR